MTPPATDREKQALETIELAIEHQRQHIAGIAAEEAHNLGMDAADREARRLTIERQAAIALNFRDVIALASFARAALKATPNA